jgi:hypothetical protein
MNNINAAIVVLTRGYHSKNYYEKLLKRNECIYENFNKHLVEQYPLIIFHEGNISNEHQQYIIDNGKNSNIKFIDVQEHFKWPSYCTFDKVRDVNFSLNYRIMCAFNSLHIWNYCREFDYIFRIDEDTFIDTLDYDVFKFMESNNLDYMVGRFCEETHPLTNITIPPFVHSLLQDKWHIDDYDQTELWVPYTNLYIANTKLFLQKEVQAFLNKLIKNPDFFYNRWGDHVVSGIILKAFSNKNKVKVIPNFTYYHGSHSCITKNGRVIEGIISENEANLFNCIPSGKGIDHYIAKELFK